jgi:N-methylhydantoinase A
VHVAVDIGGTFTDVVVFDETSEAVTVGKALSDASDLAGGVSKALKKTGIDLEQAATLLHGSTVAINAILERRGAKAALITTKGFRDVYEIGRINRPDSFNPRFKKHRPLIPRQHVFEIDERITASGEVYRPLDVEEAFSLAAHLRDEEFEAVAIVFLHSYRSPQHEVQMADILTATNPDWFVTCSHELSREYREYERTSTVAANAYVGPKINEYLTDLGTRLRDEGFRGSLSVMQSNGGLTDVGGALSHCIEMIESGPAAGVIGAVAACGKLGIPSAIAFDMGGTTAKACVVQNGSAHVRPDYYVGGYASGLVLRVPVLDIVEVGTGGGSIAWLDEGGALHVGPRSAGAMPGPAAYGRGGKEPTVTDANVALSRLAPEGSLGGDVQLDSALAVAALEGRIGGALNLPYERVARGMLDVATSAMANAVRRVTLQQGLDPREFTLFAYGGGGPLHAVDVARELAIGTVIVPRWPGHFSAYGMLQADRRRNFVQTVLVRLEERTLGELEMGYTRLESHGHDALKASGTDIGELWFERTADMRYVGQEHTVRVRIPGNLDDGDSLSELKSRFDEAHLRLYSHSSPDEPAEVVNIGVTMTVMNEKPAFAEIASGLESAPAAAKKGTRAMCFDGVERVPVSVYDRSALLAGNVISGPAALEEGATTTIVGPRDVCTVDTYGYLRIAVGGWE